MAEKGRVFVLILIFLVIISLAAAGGIYYLYYKEHLTNLKLQDGLTNAQTRLNDTTRNLEESQKKVSNLELQLRQTQAQIDTLKDDLEQEKTAKLEAQSQAEQLKMDLEQQISLKQDLEKRLSVAQEDFKKSQAQLKELETKKADLETKISEMEAKSQEGVGLGKIVVTSETTPLEQTKGKSVSGKEAKVTASLASEGKILVINKDYNFAVINLGSKDGVNLGDVFLVYHKNKYLGDIKVEKVHESMSAATFLSLEIKDKLNVDDKVVKKKGSS